MYFTCIISNKLVRRHPPVNVIKKGKQSLMTLLIGTCTNKHMYTFHTSTVFHSNDPVLLVRKFYNYLWLFNEMFSRIVKHIVKKIQEKFVPDLIGQERNNNSLWTQTH